MGIRLQCAALVFLSAMLMLAFTVDCRADDNIITSIEQASDANGLTLSFSLRGKPETRLIRLRNPDRVALDFLDTLPAASLGKTPTNGVVASIRHGLVTQDRYRYILRLKAAAETQIARRDTDAGEVLSLTIRKDGGADEAQAASQQKSALLEPAAASSSIASGEEPASKPRQLTIVIDPGHGGVDDGAHSASGINEKDINLAVGLKLRDVLASHPGMRVVLTRSDDTYIPLDERAAIGRREHANLFISIHADSIRYDALRGATVYTLSETASDALSQEVASSENAADRFAGPEWQQDKPDVFDILLDLTRRETVSFSEHFASKLVADLTENNVRLINRPKRAAGFRVLKAPDVPSVLVELGFLSNKEDEKLLRDPAWQTKTASAIGDAVVDFFQGRAAQQTATQ